MKSGGYLYKSSSRWRFRRKYHQTKTARTRTSIQPATFGGGRPSIRLDADCGEDAMT
jgi:hypothetical protein